jgi:hypothetical protein
MRKQLGSIVSLLLWASGTGYILITLSGDTLRKALWISLATLVVNVVAIALETDDE